MNTNKAMFFSGIFLCLMLLPLSACSDSESRAVRKTVEADLDDLKNADTVKIQNLIDRQIPSSVPEDQEESAENLADIFSLFYKNFSYKIDSISIQENQAEANVRLETLNAKSLAKDFSKASLKKHMKDSIGADEAEISLHDSYLLLKNLLESKEYKNQTQNVMIQLKKRGDTWEVLHTLELDRILTGNFFLYVTDSHLLSPTEIVETHFKTLRKLDSEQLCAYLSLDTLMESGDTYDTALAHAIAKQISTCFDFKIKSEQHEKDSTIVQVSITSVDFQSILNTYQRKLTKWLKTSESMAVGIEGRREKEQKLLLSCIKKNKKSISHDVDIHLLNDGVNWKIQMNDELAQAMFGDMKNTLSSSKK